MVTRQGNPASAGTQGYRVQGAPRPPPVGHRTLHGLVHRLPPPDAALRTPRRHLHSLPRAGRRPRLLQTTPTNQLRQALILQRQVVMSALVVAGAGSGLASSSPVGPVQDVADGVSEGAGDAVE